METILPKRLMVAEILRQLDTWIPDFDADSVVTGLAALDFATRVVTIMEEHFARYDLSQGRFTILMFLFHFPERTWTPAVLADVAGVSRATMTGLLQRLERDGWVERSPDPEDGRRSVIDLTPGGRQRFVEVLPDHFGRFATALEDVSASEHRRARETMERVVERLGTVVA